METYDDDNSTFSLLPKPPSGTGTCLPEHDNQVYMVLYFMVGCVLDCAKVMSSCAIGDSGTVRSPAVDIVGPQGGVDVLGACSALFQGSI